MTIRRSPLLDAVDGGGAGAPAPRSTAGWLGTLVVACVLAGSLGALAWLGRAEPGGAGSASAGPAATVQVDATKGWQTTGLMAVAASRLSLAVTAGEWTYWVGRSPMQPGTGDDYICANLMPVAMCVEPMPYERKGALIGRIGGGAPFLVGQGREVDVDTGGLVELRINDPDSALHDNGGVLTLSVGGTPMEPYPAPSQVPTGGYPAPAEPSATPPPVISPVVPDLAATPPTDAPAKEPPAADAPAAPPTMVPTPLAPALPRALPRTGGGGLARGGQ